MKAIYVNTDTFEVSMTAKDGFTRFETDLFNYLSDADIEAQFFVPKGCTYTDPVTGETYTGEYVCTRAGMATAQNLAEIRNQATSASLAAQQAKEQAQTNGATLDDVMAAIAELGDLVAASIDTESEGK